MVTIAAVPGLERTSQRFRRCLLRVAHELDVDVDHLATVISFESAGTFSPSVRAHGSPDGAVGLIQFTGGAAKALGTTKSKLARMGAVAQLSGPVVDYFRLAAGKKKLTRLVDVYLAVFAPRDIGKSDDVVIYAAPSDAYEQNRLMDRDRDGLITVGDARRKIERKFAEAHGRRLDVELVAPVAGAVALLLAAGAATGVTWILSS